MQHRVAIVVYPGFELLDATGPASVFAQANSFHPDKLTPFYEVELVSSSGGVITSSSGVGVQTLSFIDLGEKRYDTLLVSGAEGRFVRDAMRDPDLRRHILSSSKSTGRLGSVCSGSFILASLGLLDGKKATTHWAACSDLATHFPGIRVKADALFTVDGQVWTSAGVTTGIDMALAMVSLDIGSSVAGEVARQLVLYVRRPGYQSQFSPILRAQLTADHPFEALIHWVQDNLSLSLDASALAEKAGLSERTFYRKFHNATGQTPAAFVESLRLDAARILLSQGRTLKSIAREVGFSSTAQLCQRFENRFGVSPTLFRELNSELTRKAD